MCQCGVNLLIMWYITSLLVKNCTRITALACKCNASRGHDKKSGTDEAAGRVMPGLSNLAAMKGGINFSHGVVGQYVISAAVKAMFKCEF